MVSFPGEASRCGVCGYPLRGLTSPGLCPECGGDLDASHPRHRTGLSWQHSASLGAWLSTSAALLVRPSRSFRRLSLEGGRWRERAFLLSYALLSAAAWWAVHRLAGQPTDRALLVLPGLIVALTYIEASGVCYFSWREGWPVAWRTAQRVCCYAAVGWPVTAAAGAVLWMVHRTGRLDQLWPRGWAIDPAARSVITLIILCSICVMAYETFVWIGVRRVRWA